MNNSASRINRILRSTGGRRYLEIGVSLGETFFDVSAPFKVAVDPAFQFNPAEHEEEGVFYFTIPSDEFFRTFEKTSAAAMAREKDGIPRFDVIFIDGLHTFEQSYRDFIHSLRYAHDKTVWLIDDTVPSDAFSALPDQARCYRYRRLVGLPHSYAWHGDVYKTVMAIHDGHKDFFYCTVIDGGNPQTVVWKSPGLTSSRKNVCADITEISGMGYFDMAEQAHALMFGSDANLPEMLHTPATGGLSQADATALFFYKEDDLLHTIKQVAKENTELKRQVAELKKN